MKTTIKQSALFCLALSLSFLLSCDDHTKKSKAGQVSETGHERAATNPQLHSFTEDIINLERHAVNSDYGNLRISMCRYIILIDSSKVLSKIVDVLTKEKIHELRERALTIGSEAGYSERYLLAVKITYGLNKNNQIKLFYQPVFLKNRANDADTTDVVYDPLVSPIYYRYQKDSGFVEIDTSLVNKAIENYRMHISFKRDDNRYFRTFKNTDDNDSTADVKSILYSFQEMDSIMTGNKTDELYIFNAAEEMKVREKLYLKHSLILGPGELKDKTWQPIFYLKYGNLSHLCPPSCNNAPKTFNLRSHL